MKRKLPTDLSEFATSHLLNINHVILSDREFLEYRLATPEERGAFMLLLGAEIDARVPSRGVPNDTTITLPDGRVLGNYTEELKALGAWQAMANQTGAIDVERSGRKTKPEDVMRLIDTLRVWLASEQQHTASLIKTNDGLTKTIEGLHDLINTIKKRRRKRAKR